MMENYSKSYTENCKIYAKKWHKNNDHPKVSIAKENSTCENTLCKYKRCNKSHNEHGILESNQSKFDYVCPGDWIVDIKYNYNRCDETDRYSESQFKEKYL